MLIWHQGQLDHGDKVGSQHQAKHLLGFGLNQDPSNSECSALTHFSKVLAHN